MTTRSSQPRSRLARGSCSRMTWLLSIFTSLISEGERDSSPRWESAPPLKPPVARRRRERQRQRAHSLKLPLATQRRGASLPRSLDLLPDDRAELRASGARVGAD